MLQVNHIIFTGVQCFKCLEGVFFQELTFFKSSWWKKKSEQLLHVVDYLIFTWNLVFVYEEIDLSHVKSLIML